MKRYLEQWLAVFVVVLITIFGTFLQHVFPTSAGRGYGKMTYKEQADGTIMITDCEEDATEIKIPQEIGGKPVTAIDTFAFAECTQLTKLEIPDTVTSIGALCFYNTPWLAEKQKENPIVVINGILVDGTTCTGNIVIPDTVHTITEHAFWWNTALTGVVIPDSVVEIQSGAFWECRGLRTATLPSTAEVLESCVFYGCRSLTTVTVPEGVKTIGVLAFGGCYSMRAVYLPDSVVEVYENAFYNCDSLADVYYAGTEEMWQEIVITEGIECGLLTATMHYETLGIADHIMNSIEEPVLGDVNEDGTINSEDAYLCLLAYAKISVGQNPGLTENQKAAADVDGDGAITSEDGYYVLLLYAKQSVGEPVTFEELLA